MQDQPRGFSGGAAAAAKSLQSCPTLCDPIDGSPPGAPVPGILQARTLEWVAISFSNAWKWKVKVKSLSRVRLLATPWPAAHQAPPSMGFSRQEHWVGASGTSGKESAFHRRKLKRCGFDLWVGKIPWRRKWQPPPTRICLKHSMDRGTWWVTVHGVAKSWTRLSTWAHTRSSLEYSLDFKICHGIGKVLGERKRKEGDR